MSVQDSATLNGWVRVAEPAACRGEVQPAQRPAIKPIRVRIRFNGRRIAQVGLPAGGKPVYRTAIGSRMSPSGHPSVT